MATTFGVASKPVIDKDPKFKDFHTVTYELLKTEVTERLKELWALERFALGGAAAIAAWLITSRTDVSQHYPYAWWLPLIFLSLCAIKFVTGMIHLSKRSATYLQEIEKALLESNSGGYEVWFEKLGLNETWAYALVWTLALIASLVFALSKTA